MSEPRRTLALCLACLVPAGLALLGAGYVFVFWMTDPPVHTENWGEFSDTELGAIMACGVLAALGGSLLGVLTARWWRWPTAAAVTTVLLITWSIAGLFNDTNALLTLNHLAAPFTLVSSNGDEWSWHLGGSWLWRVPYLAGLCALAAIAACAHGSDGELRRRQVRWAVVVGVLTLTALLIGTITGPEGYYSWDDRCRRPRRARCSAVGSGGRQSLGSHGGGVTRPDDLARWPGSRSWSGRSPACSVERWPSASTTLLPPSPRDADAVPAAGDDPVAGRGRGTDGVERVRRAGGRRDLAFGGAGFLARSRHHRHGTGPRGRGTGGGAWASAGRRARIGRGLDGDGLRPRPDDLSPAPRRRGVRRLGALDRLDRVVDEPGGPRGGLARVGGSRPVAAYIRSATDPGDRVEVPAEERYRGWRRRALWAARFHVLRWNRTLPVGEFGGLVGRVVGAGVVSGAEQSAGS